MKKLKSRTKGWLKFSLWEQKPKTNVWYVENKETGDGLGFIKWHGPWRQYVFEVSCDETILSVSCLHDMADFLEELMEERKSDRKKAE